MADLLERIKSLRIGEKSDIDRYEDPELLDKVKPAEDYYVQLIDAMFGEAKVEGLTLPWPNTYDKFRLRPGELTIWAGQNGDGKSLILSQSMIGVIRQGAKVAIASLELHPVETLKRMTCQYLGLSETEVGERAVDEFIDTVTGKMWLYDEAGDMEPKRVAAMARYVRAELKVDHLVIDSLMKCGTMEQDYAGEKRLINSLQNISKQTGLHIHLVAHSRKPSQHGGSGKYEVKGSSTITDMADNVITVLRNRTKEKEASKPDPKQEILDKPDTYLICDKQRHFTWEGNIGLWFHDSGEFRSYASRNYI